MTSASMTAKTLSFALMMLMAARASAQPSSWTSTDVGAVTLAGKCQRVERRLDDQGDGSLFCARADFAASSPGGRRRRFGATPSRRLQLFAGTERLVIC
jgi:hypothetical protein